MKLIGAKVQGGDFLAESGDVIRDCDFKNVGSAGITIDAGAQNVLISGCTFRGRETWMGWALRFFRRLLNRKEGAAS